MNKTIAAAALAAGLLAGCTAAPAALPACQDEDYSGPVACYWDASQGNGAGQSFTWTGSTVIYSNK